MTAYLNWAMLSKPSENVKKRVRDSFGNPFFDVHRQRRKLRYILAERVEVDADRIMFAYNTTSAVVLASSLLGLDPAKRPKIIASDAEWVSLLNVLTNPNHEEANKGLVSYHTIKLIQHCAQYPDNAKADFIWRPDEGEEKLTEIFGAAGRDSVLLMSEVQRTTGLKIPVENICRNAKNAGATVIVDAAQILAPHSLHDIDFDAYVGCFHKHFGGAPALGFLVVSPGILQKFGARLLRKIENGVTIYAPAVAAAIGALLEIDWRDKEERIREMSGLLINAVKGLGFGVLRNSGDYADHIVSFRAGQNSKGLAEKLNENGWIVSYLPEIDAIRISVGARNAKDEITEFIHMVEKLV